jgi:hypothetical protein
MVVGGSRGRLTWTRARRRRRRLRHHRVLADLPCHVRHRRAASVAGDSIATAAASGRERQQRDGQRCAGQPAKSRTSTRNRIDRCHVDSPRSLSLLWLERDRSSQGPPQPSWSVAVEPLRPTQGWITSPRREEVASRARQRLASRRSVPAGALRPTRRDAQERQAARTECSHRRGSQWPRAGRRRGRDEPRVRAIGSAPSATRCRPDKSRGRLRLRTCRRARPIPAAQG